VNIFGIGLPEMALIFVVALLVFGPKKLPEVGRSLGKAIRGFQEASKEFENEFKREADEIERSVRMEATIEPPARKALSSQDAPAVSEEKTDSDASTPEAAQPDEVHDAEEVVASAPEGSAAS
jgi:sec-independent protein translocase protein TatA